MVGGVMTDAPEQLRKELERYRLVVTELQGKISNLEEELTTAATMAEVPAVVVTQPELRQTLSRLISKIAMILQAEKVLIMLYQPEPGELAPLQPSLGVTDEQAAELRISPDRGIVGEVFRTGQPLIYNDALGDDRTDKEKVALLRVRNGVCVPLRIHHRDEEERVTGATVIGVLQVMNKRFEQEFNTDDVRLTEMLGDQAAAVISNAQLYIELTEKMEQLEGDFESSIAGVAVVGAAGEVRLMNRAARRMLSISDENVAGKKLSELVNSRDVLSLFEAGLTSTEETAREVTGPGDGRIYQTQVTHMPSRGDDPPSAVAIFNDITEIRQIERMKTTFVSTVSHELRTPLTSVKGFITTLMDDTDGIYDHETRQEFYEIINSECDRLTRLITDLLNVSRIEAGRGVELHLDEVNLHEIADQVIEAQLAYTSDHAIINRLPEDMPTIVADADKLIQILENLVNNSVRYSPDGGEISITGEDEGETVKISISDHGMGIPEGHRDKIFQRFHVIDDEATRRSVKGTGIGLYLVQHLARAHGEKGSVWLEHSEVGKGSTFSFRLPKKPNIGSATG